MPAPTLAARVSRLQPTAVNRVLREVRALQSAGRQLVSLMRGQPDSPTPPHIVAAIELALHAGRTGYPDNQGEPALRQAIADSLSRRHGLDYDPQNEILVTDGATLGISVALGALLEPGAEILVPDPIYDAYSSVIALWGGKAVSVPASLREGRFCLDGAAFEAACTPATRAVLLNTPWNPVGSVLSRLEIEAVIACAEKNNLSIISDEIYEKLIYDGRRHLSPAAAARPRTVLVNSLSKTYAMTGWRVGYVAAPDELVRGMLLLLQQSSRGPATFVQDAAACALSSSQDCVTTMCKEYQARRDLVVQRLTGIPGVKPLTPEGGLFVMLDVRELGPSSDEVRRHLLHEAGVVLIHGAAYGPAGEGTLRVSFAAGGQALETGLERLRAGLLQLAPKA